MRTIFQNFIFITLLGFLVTLPLGSSLAQTQEQYILPQKGFFYTTSFSFAYVGAGSVTTREFNQFSTENLDFSRMHFGMDANVMAHYFILPKRVSLGSGLGMMRYTPVNTFSIPFIFDLRGHFIRKDYGLYPFFRLMRSPAISGISRSSTSGNIGLGYQFFLKNTPFAAEISFRNETTSLLREKNNINFHQYVERESFNFTFSMHLFANRK